MTLHLIAGQFKGRPLKTPKNSTTRPTQGMLREAIFNICQNEIENASFLDLFAGSGAMGLEALSRGAARATFVEKNREAVRCIRENIQTLQVEAKTTLLSLDVHKAIERLKGARFDLIYIDPPYDLTFPLEQLIPLLQPHALLFLEERYEPKKNRPLPSTPHLILQSTRRFGIALLSIFRYNQVQ